VIPANLMLQLILIPLLIVSLQNCWNHSCYQCNQIHSTQTKSWSM